MSQAKIFKGVKYGKLTAQYFSRKNKHTFWFFMCDCGTKKEVRIDGVYSGNVVSCGCHKNKNLQEMTHGKSKSNTYKIWVGMKQRCYNEKFKEYSNYGSRGIVVCDRWINSFENFLEDMGERPEGMTLDRIDNNKGYSKENCRWATYKTQSRNKTTTSYIHVNGEDVCLADLAEKFGIKYDCLYKRINILGWDIKRALIKHNFNYKYVKCK